MPGCARARVTKSGQTWGRHCSLSASRPGLPSMVSSWWRSFLKGSRHGPGPRPA
ncbi:hypothetical protein F751_6037 [Auxenochlorella protothecoides]|uniref:Uncharacterized protein n=1 Tax=Auxenochlorella protothecoides TaxID=3075 RepID=A0A087SI25_AUXPR|nr:hypothetical protein F751_6037 [Auxenochlorella protothecoides]KFM25379.1 hypothetical protein F751_6037 [Auxenochlorella protothecoides]